MSQTARSSHPLQLPKRSTLFEQTCDRLGLSAAAREQLEAYVATLGKWQPRLNLIGPKTWADVWDRHVVDSLQCLDHLGTADEGRGWADIGTGAGFPGVVMALATGIPVRLVESDQRKAVFLSTVIRECGLTAKVHNSRIEALPDLGASVITARALAPLDRLLRLLGRQLTSGTRCLFLKGARAEAEIAAAGEMVNLRQELYPSLTNPDGFVIDLTVT